MSLRSLLTAALLCWSAAAVADPLRDFRHTTWGAGDGAPAQISALAQTPDGWLWLATADGLYRFDGVTFEHVPLPERGMLARELIYTLYAADNGDLLIGHLMGGLSVLRANGRYDDMPDAGGAPGMPVPAMLADSDGSLWTISAAGVFHRRDTWRKVVDSAGWKKDAVDSLLRDQDNTLWATFDQQVWRLDRAHERFVPAGPAGAAGSLIQSPDGRVWATRAGLLVQVSNGMPGQRAVRGNQSEGRWGGQFDRAGNLWKLRCPDGVCLLPAAPAATPVLDPAGLGQHVNAPPHISGAHAEQALEDREGNIWIATENGLDRYQPNRVLQSGLPGSGTPLSLAADADGAVWAADQDSGKLWRLRAGAAPELQAGRYARIVGTARDGALLVAGKRTIERRLHGVVDTIALPPKPDGKPADLTVLGILDDGKVLWVAAYETGLMGYADGRWQPRSAFNLPPKIVIAAAGAPGQLWLADGDGGFTLYDAGKLTRYDAAAAGLATAVFAGPQVMVAGAHGLAVLQQGSMRMLRAARPDALRNISGMAITPDGDRWFNGAAGIAHVRAADWAHALATPQALLRLTVLDGRDGYPGQAATANRLPSVVQAAGGQLWFAGTGGVVRLETRTLQPNAAAPVVHITQVGTHEAVYPAAPGGVRLPAGVADFQVGYAAPALRRPEDIRYTYWLEGVDRGWVDAGVRHSASYANVAPGSYRFHVRATNEDGVAGANEAVQAIVIAPTMRQSAWFKALCAALAVLAGVAIYRYRIRILTARLVAQMQVRASERERIARTLHDTYLQSVHALLLRVGTMAQSLPGGDPTRAGLETVLADASHAVVEGRSQVEQLRAGSPAALADVLEDTIENVLARSAGPLRQCYPDVAYAMQVTGTRRPLTPAVLNEAGQIGAEALRNAFIHAGAGRIDVVVDYGAAFGVQVRDDGKGLDDDVRQAGYRSGHWGLLGMRERALDIGAVLAIESAAGAGTAIVLTVPAARAYVTAVPGRSRLARWFTKRLVGGSDKTT